MTTFFPATTVTIYTDATTVNEFNDPVSNETISASGVPANIAETAFVPRFTADANQQRPAALTNVRCTLPADTVIETTWSLLDERTGKRYLVDAVTTRPPAPGVSPITVILRRRNIADT